MTEPRTEAGGHPPELPPSWDDWDLEAVVELVHRYDFEPGYFDFKEALTGKDPKLSESIRKTAAAMANGDGGFLIFGVKDRATGGRTIEERIVGVPLKGDLLADFGRHAQHIRPVLTFDAIPRPIGLNRDPTRGVFVVHVPRSQLRPHMCDYRFWRRGDGGTAVEMDFYEVREQMQFTEERLRRVACCERSFAYSESRKTE